MSTDAVRVEGWPRPKGYENAVIGRGQPVHVAGQIAWNERGEFTSDDPVVQFGQALANVVTVLAAAGAQPTDVASMTVYVTDIEAYRRGGAGLAEVWRAHMGRHFPAMALVAVCALVEPAARVEISAIAYLDRKDP